MKKVAIHQPNFFPWLGYFIKMEAADSFVYLDDVEYTKKSLTRRTWIRGSNEDKTYFRVDIAKHSDYVYIKDIELRNSREWSKKAIDVLHRTYKYTSYNKEASDILVPLIHDATNFTHFAPYSMYILESLRTTLGIDTHTFCSSEIHTTQKKSERNIEIVQLSGGGLYLSGMGAKKYQSEASFLKANIELRYVDPYPYLVAKRTELPFLVPEFSIIDALYQVGLDNLKSIVKGYTL